MLKNVLSAVALVTAILAGVSEVLAWKANYPGGPVRSTNARPAGVRLFGPIGPGLVSIATSGSFADRKLPYPSSQGVDLGSAWDMFQNTKKPVVCVEFEEAPDNNYQNVELGIQEVTDEDTLDITLNTQFSGSAGGNIEGVFAKGDATSTLNASHHVASKDITFTARTSVTSGIRFTGPTGPMKTKSVRLTPEMHKLAVENSTEFERQCGHGYVHSIGNGADLYLLFHFHGLETKDRLDLSFDSHASASMEDVFQASGSSKLAATIDRLSKEQKLDLSFVQMGGKIDSLPTSLDEAKAQVKKLAAEEFTNPRRIYVTVSPYSTLPNYSSSYTIETSDLRQRATRYIERLNSIIFEARNIRLNLYRDRSDTTTKDEYYYYYRHQLRAERPSDIADGATTRRQIAIDALRKLSAPPCDNKPFSWAPVPAGLSNQDRKAFESNRKHQIAQLEVNYVDCKKIGDDLISQTDNFEDLSLWAGLPIPLNSITDDSIAKLDNVQGDLNERKNLYAQNVFRHWIERQDQVRCRLLEECLSGDEMTALYKKILDSFKGVTVVETKPSVVVTFCIAEEDSDCTSDAVHLDIQRNFGCNFNSKDKEAGEIICKDRGQFSSGVRRIRTDNPYKQCGRSISNVGCYSYIQQPTFPRGP
jgi:hypothetical protein